jgi:hypothetical protein
MYVLMLGQRFMAESEEPIVYIDSEKGWKTPQALFCDEFKDMTVIESETSVQPGAPNVVG